MRRPRLPEGLPGLPDGLAEPTTDAHTHLSSTEQFSGLAVADAIAAAAAVGVSRLVEVGTDLDSSVAAVAIADAHPGVIASIALHPNDAARAGERLDADLDALARLAPTSPRIRAIGETGLDYFRTTDAPGRARQRESFAAHIDLARRHELALVIHDRDAHDDVLAVLDECGVPDRLMMHCFSGDADFARRCLDRGAYLSFPGTVTFKPNEALREAFDLTPTDRLLVETDAPYLTPVPFRSRPNASYLLPYTVRALAERRGCSEAQLAGWAAANATALFGDWGTNA